MKFQVNKGQTQQSGYFLIICNEQKLNDHNFRHKLYLSNCLPVCTQKKLKTFHSSLK